jgi:hypothetical protein
VLLELLENLFLGGLALGRFGVQLVLEPRQLQLQRLVQRRGLARPLPAAVRQVVLRDGLDVRLDALLGVRLLLPVGLEPPLYILLNGLELPAQGLLRPLKVLLLVLEGLLDLAQAGQQPLEAVLLPGRALEQLVLQHCNRVPQALVLHCLLLLHVLVQRAQPLEYPFGPLLVIHIIQLFNCSSIYLIVVVVVFYCIQFVIQ